MRQLLQAIAGVMLLAGLGASDQKQAAPTARARAEEMLEIWNATGNKLIAMARDFPEEFYDFKVQSEERTFAQNLLHVAAVDYDLMGIISGAKMGPVSARTSITRRVRFT